MNFAEHEHDFDPCTYRCRMCGIDELELVLLEAGFKYDVPGETLEQFVKGQWFDSEHDARYPPGQ